MNGHTTSILFILIIHDIPIASFGSLSHVAAFVLSDNRGKSAAQQASRRSGP